MTPVALPSPADLSPAARAAEITAILATAIVRTLGQQATREPSWPWLPARAARPYNPLSTREVVMNETQTSVAARLAELAKLPMSELWVRLGPLLHPPPGAPEPGPHRVAPGLQDPGGGLRRLAPATRQRLEAIGAQHSKIKLRAKPRDLHFAPGTVLLREWGEREHKVTVTAEGLFAYEGATFKSLTAVARHITGAHWSGPLFFGLGRAGRGPMNEAMHGPLPQAPAALCGLLPGVHRRAPRPGVQLHRRPARGGSGLYRQPAHRGLDCGGRRLRRPGLLRGKHRPPRLQAPDGRHRGRPDRYRGRLQDRSAHPQPGRLCADGRGLRTSPGVFRLGHPADQLGHLHGAADVERPAVLRPVRAGGYG